MKCDINWSGVTLVAETINEQDLLIKVASSVDKNEALRDNELMSFDVLSGKANEFAKLTFMTQ